MSPSRRKKDEEHKVMSDGKSNKENIPEDEKPYATWFVKIYFMMRQLNIIR